jgi:hypothetical protein
MKILVSRILQIDYIDGQYFYNRLQHSERHGPFEDVPTLLQHLTREMEEEI